MKKTNFTLNRPTSRMNSLVVSHCCRLLPLLLVFLFSNSAIAQYCSLSCNDNVQVSLNQNCEAPVTYDMILEDGDNPATCSPNGVQAFVVSVFDADGNDIGNVVDGAYIGQTLVVKVKHWATGNICWGTISIEDKQMPSISCTDAHIWCNEFPDPSLTGYPTASDNCDNSLDRTYVDEFTNLDCDDDYSGVIRRTWTVCDDSGNCNSCDQYIYFDRLTIGDLVIPRNYDDIDLPALNCTNPNTDPTNTGYPGMHGINVDAGSEHCEINVTYEDLVIDVCEGSYKILRNWTLVDWCTGEIVNHTQVIKVLDKQGPTIDCSDLDLAASPWSCEAAVTIPAAPISDNCGTTIEVVTTLYGFVAGPYGTGGATEVLEVFDGNGGSVTLPAGNYFVTYAAVDDCDNTSECTANITITDQTAPIAACDEITQTTLLSNGLSQIQATTFDDGSYDNCCDASELTFHVKRMGQPNSAYNDYVEFNCNDACGDPVMVVLRVTDCNGYSSECMIEVLVDDKTDPIIDCPDNVTVDCDEDPYAAFGEPTITEACGYNVEVSDSGSIDECGNGSIRRTWTVTDDCGNSASCSQRVTSVHVDNWNVNFPNDDDAYCVTADELGPENTGTPSISGDDCEIIAVNYEDQVFVAEEDACYKIIRTWTAINWCVYNPENPNSGGIETGIQKILVYDDEAPELTCPGLQEVCIEGNACSTTVTLPMPEWTDCNPNTQITATGDLGNGFGPFSNVGPGEYNVYVTADDGCNNVSTCEFKVIVEDCKLPTPVCQFISTTIMPTTGMIEIWATDFEADGSSFDNCTAFEDLEYRIRKVNEFDPPNNNLPNTTSVTFDCNELGTQWVDMWVIDEAGNADHCRTYVVIQDPNGSCGDPDPTGAMIMGRLQDEMDMDVTDVSITMAGAGVTFPTVITDLDGFTFENVPMHGNYTVTPEKDINHSNGVSTYDLVLIQKHILGVAPLDSPYKIIAADVNRSNTVSTFDIVQIRRLILHIDTEFENNTSWRFVDKDFVFPSSNPFETTFPEVISFNDLDDNEMATDFVSIKVGDVNNSAIANEGLVGTQNRNKVGSLAFNVENQLVKAGETVTVDFAADQAALGYQFTLNFDQNALEFVDVVNGNADNFGLAMLDEGVITTSWNTTTVEKAAFSLTFTAKSDVELSKALTINSRYTTAEAYNANADLLDVALTFNGQATASTFELFQNRPNPFTQSTAISFNLAEAGNATLTVYDVSGKVLMVNKGAFAKGYNEVQVNKADLSGAGVLYYKLETANNTAVKKMLLVD